MAKQLTIPALREFRRYRQFFFPLLSKSQENKQNYKELHLIVCFPKLRAFYRSTTGSYPAMALSEQSNYSFCAKLGWGRYELYKSNQRSRSISKQLQFQACSLDKLFTAPMGPEAAPPLPALMFEPLLFTEIKTSTSVFFSWYNIRKG